MKKVIEKISDRCTCQLENVLNDPEWFEKCSIDESSDHYNPQKVEPVLRMATSDDRDLLYSIITEQWKLDVSQGNPNVVTFRDGKMVPVSPDFPSQLHTMKVQIDAVEKTKADLEQLKREWSTTRSERNAHSAPLAEVQNSTIDAIHFSQPPVPVPSSELLHLSDLPEDVRKWLLIEDDETYTFFVSVMRDDIWPMVCDNKGKYCDIVRFLCNKHYITARNTIRKDFDKLWRAIMPEIEESLESSMKRSPYPTNKDSSYRYYNSIPDHQKKIWGLQKDAEPFDEALQPVVQMMGEKQRQTTEEST